MSSAFETPIGGNSQPSSPIINSMYWPGLTIDPGLLFTWSTASETARLYSGIVQIGLCDTRNEMRRYPIIAHKRQQCSNAQDCRINRRSADVFPAVSLICQTVDSCNEAAK